jgi:3',5'-cyclic AMP phosphodiesterase CpdA
MVIAHLSDFHVSRFGVRLTQLRGRSRTARDEGWDEVRREDGWRIQARRARGRIRRRDLLRLVDDTDLIHETVKLERGGASETAAVDELLRLMARRHRTMPATLARHPPAPDELRTLLAVDPDNTNLRFCAVAHAMREAAPDRVVITGDVTDDAVGYELVREGLAPFVERGHLVAIPGNHDIYPSPPLWVDKGQRKTEAEKRRLWGAFATSVGLPSGGCYVHDLGDGLVLACMDSCHPPPVPGSASGLVPLRDLHHLAGELQAHDGHALRMGCLHHHVVNPPLRGVGHAPFQGGMRLRNARAVFEVLRELDVRVVLNGHRHVGYRFHPAHAPLFLSSPSSTAGCRSGAEPYWWRLEASRRGVRSVEEVPFELLHAVRGG